MITRSFACFLLGLWAGGEILLALAALSDARATNRMLSEPEPAVALMLKDAGPAGVGLVRGQASARLRELVLDWGAAQLALGAFCFLFLLFGTQESKRSLALALAMLLLALLQQALATLRVSAAIGVTDFGAAFGSARLIALNGSYVGLGALKWGAGAWLTFRLAKRRRGRADEREPAVPAYGPGQRPAAG